MPCPCEMAMRERDALTTNKDTFYLTKGRPRGRARCYFCVGVYNIAYA